MARTKKGRAVSGWLVVDKPAGITSTAVVNKVKWAFQAQKAGHAGTLDPAATGVLAVALGEVLQSTGGLWFGWSGHIVDEEPAARLHVQQAVLFCSVSIPITFSRRPWMLLRWVLQSAFMVI